MRRAAAVLSACLVLLLMGGCGRQTPQATEDGVRFTDALGREVAVDRPARVAALMGGFAETWLLAGGELAGVTRDALTQRGLDLPEDIPVLGEHNAPSGEALLALAPDLVLLSSETTAHVELLDLLERAGIPCAYFRVNHFDDYLDMLHTCTRITGREDLYESAGLAVRREIERLTEHAPREDAPSILLLITHSGGAAVQDSSTMAGRMLAELGCDNLADRDQSLLGELSLEHILTADPDYIFVIPMGNDGELERKNLREALERHPAWSGLSAVRSGRYHLLPKELFLYKPNARWGESYAFLAQCLT